MNTKAVTGLIAGATTQSAENLITTLPKHIKPIANYLKKQELKGASLANARFIQDTATNFVPKAIFSRSAADLADVGFLEILENVLVYYCPTFFGEKVFRKAYSANLAPNLSKKVSEPLVQLVKNKDVSKEALAKIKPIKAAIALSSMLIPLTEFTLNYFKNLFTLKVFKQADFENIANLNKNQSNNKETREDIKKQNHVERSAHKNILAALGVFAGCLAGSVLLAKKGENSKVLQKVSDLILTPGNVLCKKNENLKNTINKYFSLDFAQKAGKLALGHGQLTACVLIGGIGYFGAAKDRGKQNFLETAFRYPLVGFSVITGSELIEKGFKKFLKNKNGFKELINKDMTTTAFSKLPEIAARLAKTNNTTVEKEFGKLCCKKAIIPLGPYAFNLLFMGLFVAGVSRFFTQYRYNKEQRIKTKTLSQNIKPASVKTDTTIENFKKRTRSNIEVEIFNQSKGIDTKLKNNPFQKMLY